MELSTYKPVSIDSVYNMDFFESYISQRDFVQNFWIVFYKVV